jgi:mRNA interferase MazF
MKRGDLVIVALPGDYGKPRPALIVQGDAFGEIASVTVLPLTTDLQPAHLVRIAVGPTQDNGLQQQSHVMIDKATTLARSKVGRQIGRLDFEAMAAVGAALARFFEIE